MSYSLYFKQRTLRTQKSRHKLALLTVLPGILLLGGMSKACMAQVAATTEESRSSPEAAITLTGDAQPHTFFSQTVTMPASGCPCFLRVEGQIVIGAPLDNATDSPSLNLEASDGTNSADLLHQEPIALALSTTESGIFADELTLTPVTIGTSYENNQKVTLTLFYRAIGLSTPPITLQPSVKDPAATDSIYKSFILISAGPVPAPSPTVPKFGSGTF
jgi:hypothetical protein